MFNAENYCWMEIPCEMERWHHYLDITEGFEGSNPIEVAEYVTARSIQDEPAFVWWIPFTLRKRDMIISSVNFRTRKATQKYGIEIPTSIKHAEEIDRRNKNTFWKDSIHLEMSNIGVTFKILDTGETPPPG